MKIVVFPGVGADVIKEPYEYFLDEIKRGLNCEGEIFVWENGHKHPHVTPPFRSVRHFVCETILDFQQVVVHAMEMQVPDADIYIGHSAGSILALAQNRPVVTFASPAALVELIDATNETAKDCRVRLRANNNKVLNIINKYDVIAYPINGENVENYEYSGPWYNPLTYFPVTAHTHYWRCEKAIDKIIKTIKSW